MCDSCPECNAQPVLKGPIGLSHHCPSCRSAAICTPYGYVIIHTYICTPHGYVIIHKYICTPSLTRQSPAHPRRGSASNPPWHPGSHQSFRTRSRPDIVPPSDSKVLRGPDIVAGVAHAETAAAATSTTSAANAACAAPPTTQPTQPPAG